MKIRGEINCFNLIGTTYNNFYGTATYVKDNISDVGLNILLTTTK